MELFWEYVRAFLCGGLLGLFLSLGFRLSLFAVVQAFDLGRIQRRALLLLQDNGILKLKDGAGLTATVLDIEENPYNVEILELEAAQVPRVKDEVAYVVLNGNYALDAGFSVAKDSLAYEKSDSDAAKTYVNVIAVKEGNENSEKIQALVAALKSDTIRQYINDTYDGAVVPFDD